MDALPVRKKYRKLSRFLKSAVTVHDQTQVETVFDFILKPKSESRANLNRKHRYKVEAYFFYPSQMQVDGNKYSRQMFLDDMQPQIRLQEPTFNYGEFKGKNAGHLGSPIVSLKAFLEKVQRGNIDQFQSEAVEYVRLFACSYSKFMHKKVSTILKRFKDISKLSDDHEVYQQQITLVVIALDKIHDLLSEWRKLSYEFYRIEDGFLVDLKHEFRLSNEFFSYRMRDSLSKIKSEVLNLEENELTLQLIKKHAAFTRLEHWYAQKHKFIWLKKDSPTRLRERFLVRFSSLKRRMLRVLYLEVRTKPLFSFQKQIGFMMAAAFAAAWAFLANLFLFARMSQTGMQQMTIENLGTGGVVVVSGFILAYVLKDRIKDLGREHFKGGLFNQLPNTDERIQYRNASGKIFNIGNIKEFTRVISFKDLPEQIKKQRSIQEGYRGERQDDGIIHYKKVVEIDGKSLSDHEMPIYGIHDILRYKIDRFTNRMGDELQHYWGLDPDSTIFHLKIPKVYHIDMIIDYSRQNSKKEMSHLAYDCRRLVINKRGLVRVDRLHSE